MYGGRFATYPCMGRAIMQHGNIPNECAGPLYADAIRKPQEAGVSTTPTTATPRQAFEFRTVHDPEHQGTLRQLAAPL